MDDIERVRKWLLKNRWKWDAVIVKAGVKRSWIEQFAYGRVRSPYARNFIRVARYIDNEDN